MLFLIFQEGKSKKIAPEILRFVTMFFWDGRKNCATDIKSRKYAFLIFEKGMTNKTFDRKFKVRKYSFFNIRKRNGQINCARTFKIRKYAFFNI